MDTAAKRKKWFERNEQAEELEREGDLVAALALYEQNAAEGCDLAFTYERLAAIYRHQKRYDAELQALEQALFIERKRGPTAQLVRLQQRIETTHAVRRRAQEIAQQVHTREVSPIVRTEAGAGQERAGCFTVVFVATVGAALLLALV